MKTIFLIIIRLYWKIIPPSKRNRCLFKESCSNIVYRTTQEKGIKAAIKVFLFRFQHCRDGYQLFKEQGVIKLITAKKHILENDEIHPRLIGKLP